MRLRHLYYILDADRHVVKVDIRAWSRKFGLMNRQVGLTEINGDVQVSTVFLGIDHRHFGEGPPLLFETMIFGGKLDHSMWRYCSWDDAEAGHQAAVRKAMAA